MNIKIQGGGNGKYSNSNSSFGVVSYLRHEDLKRQEEGKNVEYFFSNNNDAVLSQEVTDRIDKNKAKLCKADAKFYVVTVSPSKDEISSTLLLFVVRISSNSFKL